MKTKRRYVIKYHSGKYIGTNGFYLETEKAAAQTYTHAAALRECKKRDGYPDWRTNGHFRIVRTKDA